MSFRLCRVMPPLCPSCTEKGRGARETHIFRRLLHVGIRAMPDDGDCCPVCENTFQPIPRGEEKSDLTFSHIPKILKGCLHTICQSCAEEKLQRSKDGCSVECPLCGSTSSNTPASSDIQDNICVLQDIHRKSRDCDFCDEPVKASHLCSDCEGLLCTFHANAHAVSRGTKKHNLVPLGSREREGALRGISRRVPITCQRHKDVPAKLFCSEPCNTTICYDCSVTMHSGHTVLLADSEELELSQRADLTRQGVAMGHRLARLQGALDAIESVKTGVEQHSQIAEKNAVRVFSAIRAAVNSREKAVLKNLRAHRTSKTQDLDAQLEKLEQMTNVYAAALEALNKCVEKLHGHQLLAMVPTLRECLDEHEAIFPSLELHPCVDDRMDFEHDERIAVALQQGIAQVGYLVQNDADFRRVPDRKQEKQPPKDLQPSTQDDHNVHFTLNASVGTRPQEATLASSTDVVVVEVRKGPEYKFFKNGITGPVIGRVALHTKLQSARHLMYESEHFLESLSHKKTPQRPQRRREPQQHQKEPSLGDDKSGNIPTVRFTKTIRVLGRRESVGRPRLPV